MSKLPKGTGDSSLLTTSKNLSMANSIPSTSSIDNNLNANLLFYTSTTNSYQTIHRNKTLIDYFSTPPATSASSMPTHTLAPPSKISDITSCSVQRNGRHQVITDTPSPSIVSSQPKNLAFTRNRRLHAPTHRF